jgi:mRNA interferase HigB
MRIISRKPLREFAVRCLRAKGPLDAWFAEASRAKWACFAEVKASYRSADVVSGNRVIFDIGGNKYRLVVKMAYKCGTVYVRFVGTHDEYDIIDPETI